jgi:hypothetical protein
MLQDYDKKIEYKRYLLLHNYWHINLILINKKIKFIKQLSNRSKLLI